MSVEQPLWQKYRDIEKIHLIVLVLNDQVLSSERYESKSNFSERQDK
mgnify:CR=1 FL=1